MAQERVMGRGSAATLKGVAYTLSIFVDQGDARWTKEQKLALLENGRTAERWLVQQAKRYGVTLSFHDGAAYGLDQSFFAPTLPTDEEDRVEVFDLMRQALRSLKHEEPHNHFRAIVRQTGVTTVHAVLYVNSEGVSCAMPFYDGSTQDRLLEGCVVHRADSRNGQETGPRTIAHEILHLYGAWDFYERPEYTPEQVALATREFPNDVMLCADPDLAVNEVGPLTAWRIGWQPKQDWYEDLRPADK